MSGHVVVILDFSTLANAWWEVHANYLVTRTMMDGTMTVFSTGEYRDRIVLVDGQTKFKERVVICDHSMINNLIVLPL